MTLNPQQSWEWDATTPLSSGQMKPAGSRRLGVVSSVILYVGGLGQEGRMSYPRLHGTGYQKNMPLSQRENKDWGVLSTVNERLWF